MRRSTKIVAIAVLALMILVQPSALAIHWYRGPGGGCTANDGATFDQLPEDRGSVAASVMLGHNTFNDSETLMPTTTINVGEAVTWTWNSAHCHSVTFSGTLGSGYHYPSQPPESPQVVPGFFEYPVLDDTPTLSYTHTFTEPGEYSYYCVHHAAIGMVGTIVVEE